MRNAQIISITSKKALEGGLYTLKEAALYAGITTRRLKQWYLGDNQSKAVFQNDLLIESGEYINFLDFVQALGIRELRTKHKMPLTKIRHAINFAKREYGIDYLFAKDHKTRYDNKHILIEVDNQLIEIIAPHHNQITMQIVEEYLDKLRFNNDGYACQYRPKEGILLDPLKRFGEPIVEGTGIPAIVLHHAVKTEGNMAVVAELYEVKKSEVENAYKYINSLKTAA